MGGIGFEVAVAEGSSADADLDALHREVWALAERRIWDVVRLKSSRYGVAEYLSMESSDGFADGDWFATRNGLHFSFGDAAGMCVGEMYASLHWTRLALLDRWADVAAAGTRHGVALTPPGDLTDLLTGPADPVFFRHRGKFLRAEAGEDDTPVREVCGDFVAKLDELRGDERDRIAGLVRDRVCACEMCQKLRKARGLPLAPEAAPKKAPGKAAPARAPEAPQPRYDLAAAPVRSYVEAKALASDPAEVVALDLGRASWTRVKTPASFLAKLPAYPVRALSLAGHGLRGIPPGVLALRDLEVLSLRGCSMRAPLADGLGDLTRLRGLDLDGNLYKDLVTPALFRLTNLEILDYHWGWGAPPPQLYSLPKLRHVDVTRGTPPASIADLPVESVIWWNHDGVPFDRWPLRYLQTGGTLPSAIAGSTLTDLALSGDFNGWDFPDAARELPPLRSLQVIDVRGLPDWLPDTQPGLQALRVDSKALATDPAAFRAIERLTELRILALSTRHEAGRLPFDISGLRQLELLVISSDAPDGRAGLPAGIEGLPRLRRFRYGARLGEAGTAALREAVPDAKWNSGQVWQWSPLSFYRALTPRGSVDWYLARFAERDHWIDLVEPE